MIPAERDPEFSAAVPKRTFRDAFNGAWKATARGPGARVVHAGIAVLLASMTLVVTGAARSDVDVIKWGLWVAYAGSAIGLAGTFLRLNQVEAALSKGGNPEEAGGEADAGPRGA